MLLALAVVVALAGSAVPASVPGVPAGPVGSVVESTLEQPLDHFSQAERRTWKQRYFASSSYFPKEGPAGPTFILLLGGQEVLEEELDLDSSHALQLAKDLEGRAFALEHRYYGTSLPTGDMSLANLTYLNDDQAVADVAAFVAHLRESESIPPSSRVVLYGGLHAGALAVWARVRHPDLVHAVVASSATLRTKLDFPEYEETAMKILEKFVGPGCRQDIATTSQYIEDRFNSPGDGLAELKTIFNLCAAFGANASDLDTLLYRVSMTVVDLTLRENSEDMAVEVCGELGAAATPKDKAVVLSLMGGFGEIDPCVTADFAGTVAEARKEQWADSSEEQTPDRLSLYQSCFELGQFHSLATMPEWKYHLPLAVSLAKCEAVFGKSFDKAALEASVGKANSDLAVKKSKITRVVFVVGEDDPYRNLTVQTPLGDSAPVLTIAGAIHCRDMEESSEDDSETLTEARAQIKKYIVSFLEEAPQETTHISRRSTTTVPATSAPGTSAPATSAPTTPGSGAAIGASPHRLLLITLLPVAYLLRDNLTR